jgi:superfamily II DNA or RNA helicase
MTTQIKEIPFQAKAANEVAEKLRKERGVLIQAGTGVGKTYITAKAIKNIIDELEADPKVGGKSPIPVLWIAPAATIIQTRRVLKAYGIIRKVMVLSYSALTSPKTGGVMYYASRTVVTYGQENIVYDWCDVMLPKLVVFDECQALKNEDSTRTSIARGLPDNVKRIFISATPYQRVCEARTVMVGVGMRSAYNVLPLTQNTAPAVMRSLATYGNTTAYSPRAMEKVKDVMQPYTVNVKGIRFKYKARTECVLINFRNNEEREAYNNAYNEYLEKLYRLRGQTGHGILAARLVAMQKFRQKAEEIRSPIVAGRANNAVQEGSQVIIASNFKNMLRGAWLALTERYGYDKDRIGFVTGKQSAEQRQRHVDEFQEGKRDIMLLTLQAGGVGISLHHEQDNARPRHIILPPTWSAIDLIQCLGRSHRITSQSNTLQEVLWYKNTIEERVAAVVENKVKCINKAVSAKEQWASLFAPSVDDELGVTDDVDDEIDHGIDEGLLE